MRTLVNSTLIRTERRSSPGSLYQLAWLTCSFHVMQLPKSTLKELSRQSSVIKIIHDFSVSDGHFVVQLVVGALRWIFLQAMASIDARLHITRSHCNTLAPKISGKSAISSHEKQT